MASCTFSPPVVSGGPSRKTCSTLYDYFDLWSWDGTLDLIHHELYVKCRKAIGREASPTAAVIIAKALKALKKGGFD